MDPYVPDNTENLESVYLERNTSPNIKIKHNFSENRMPSESDWSELIKAMKAQADATNNLASKINEMNSTMDKLLSEDLKETTKQSNTTSLTVLPEVSTLQEKLNEATNKDTNLLSSTSYDQRSEPTNTLQQTDTDTNN
ncbi:uncharacterized protein LOC122502360 [Leptopilina heterotoma]|uniref:uncharacterized protein LOC122502360 n=1 Tax=Leptopilina heterotoma TaxID=63436 RepID=UPI001CA8E6B5|nr:uncharacterized protein LOC122502360 [Leptopilina heterotoma]